MKRLILVGGGHAHLAVLKKLATCKPAQVETFLVSPDRWQTYSGMLPGWLAGHYRVDQLRIDLVQLAAAAGVTFIQQSIVGIDADRRDICLGDGRHLDYHLLSLDVGSEPDQSWLADFGARLLSIKPLAKFQQGWSEHLQQASARGHFDLVVVGGGAAGVELALAAQHQLRRAEIEGTVTLVTGQNGLLSAFPSGVRKRAVKALTRAAVKTVQERAVGADGSLLLNSGEHVAADVVLAATGAQAPAWLKMSRLKLDQEGFVLVDPFQRSVSHANVFGAGDVCTRVDTDMARSGVHAVRAGPVLADNLLASLQGALLRPYQPKRRTLYLLATGPRHAIASWGSLHTEGAWVWRWKDWIDRRFIKRFSPAHLPSQSLEPMP